MRIQKLQTPGFKNQQLSVLISSPPRQRANTESSNESGFKSTSQHSCLIVSQPHVHHTALQDFVR